MSAAPFDFDKLGRDFHAEYARQERLFDELAAGKRSAIQGDGFTVFNVGAHAQAKPIAPTKHELELLAGLCSPREWEGLLTSHRFIDATCHSLAETEKIMSRRLGRKISVSQASVSNPGDEKL